MKHRNPHIANCDFQFQIRCPLLWETLDITGDPNVAHCTECNRDVYRCDTPDDVKRHANAGHCVAIFYGLDESDELMGYVEEF